MGTLMVDFITSLDGYGAAEGWPGWWGMESPEYLGWLGEQPEHTVLMGATTYRLMAEFAANGEEGVDQLLTQLSKVVFSSTLTEPLAWANTRLVTGDAVAAVRAMKEDSRIEMRTLGSVSLCRSLITAELVDRFRVVVFPVVTGATGQDRIYDGYPDVRLDLVESRTFERRAPTVGVRAHRARRSAGYHGSGELSEATAAGTMEQTVSCSEAWAPGAGLHRASGSNRLGDCSRRRAARHDLIGPTASLAQVSGAEIRSYLLGVGQHGGTVGDIKMSARTVVPRDRACRVVTASCESLTSETARIAPCAASS